MDKPSCIRVAIDRNGQARFWAMMPGKEDYEKTPLNSSKGLHLITGGGVPMEFACFDPQDGSPHNYEILLDLPDGSTMTQVKLTRI